MANGVAASPGIGIGNVFLLDEGDLIVPRHYIPREGVKREVARFRKALDKTKREMAKDTAGMLKILGKTHARLGEAYLMIIEDPLLTSDVERQISKELLNAELAVQTCLEKVSHTFENMNDEYFRERKNDIVEVGGRIIRQLLGKTKRSLSEMKEESIVVAHNLLPSDTVALRSDLVKGFAIDVGGKTSHTALLAQSLEIPAVVGLRNITSRVQNGQPVIVDGSKGDVLIDPPPQALVNYRREREILVRESKDLVKLRDLPAQTLDGKRIELSANVESADDAKAVLAHGSEGIGLFRTEYLYLNRSTLPTEDEQFEHYSRVAKQMLPYTTVFRTLDIGGDKLAAFVDGLAEERNPFLGLRALRFSLRNPEIFRAQLRALLRASVKGKMRIMFPMVSGIEEFRSGKAILDDEFQKLSREGVPIAKKVELGAMIEVPSAAVIADVIAKEADFLSIGTNDLIQYTLAIDRVNENVTHLYEPMHLAILRLVKMTADAGHQHGKWVGMCGDMASDLKLTPLLLGLGLDELSVVPSFVPKVKQAIRATNLADARALAEEILSIPEASKAQDRLNRVKLSLI
ncbi:MAG: phosphoenolpyruvate--protein phosphotransferase [Elusimicrobia bacterium RIFCSPLOWO2_01_FULL_60_11]|nr:MAG: phosphoenolpyruvate--protein phosphotransferase [Elusimicrobia bacterium RIFCSPLOWO2_01_FULL_60_11]